MGKLALVEGEVMVRTDAKTLNIDLYSEEFILDDDIKDINEARSVIKNGLLDERLKKTVKNYRKYRTYEIIEFKDTDKKSEQSDYDKLMVKAVKNQCVPENLDSYATQEGKQKALERALDTKKKREAKKVKDNVEDQGYID
jgi:hypothetical protein